MGCVLALGACYAPAPKARADLAISQAGAYTLNGKPVTASELGAALATLTASSPAFMLQIRASPLAPIDAVSAAVGLARQVKAGVAFASEATLPPVR
jgi:biopolymer transport protein ExbD